MTEDMLKVKLLFSDVVGIIIMMRAENGAYHTS